MGLLPEALKEKLPGLGGNSGGKPGDVIVYTRLVDPTSNWRWYILEFDGEDTCYGLVVTGKNALAGHFTLSELKALRYYDERFGTVGVQRDTFFEPLTLEQLMEKEPKVRQAFASSGLNLIDLGLD